MEISKETMLHLQSELSKKERQLASYSILLNSKNQQLQEIVSALETFNKQSYSQELAFVIRKLNQAATNDQEILNFFSYFQKTDPGFISRLDELKNLTLNEKKLCSYIRMGLDNKQIGALLNVDAGSVRKAQSRMKKKLNLNGNLSLRDFVLRL